MKRFILVLLATSLTANAWLAIRIAQSETLATASPAPTANAAAPTPPIVPIAALEADDPATWRDQLREAGADEATVRAIIEGQLRQRHRSQLSAKRVEQLRTTWWRNDTRTISGEDAQLLKATVQAPLRELVGRDPLDVQDAEKRFAFLPPEKRRMLAEIELDYAEMAGAGRGTASTLKSDIDRHDLLAEERRKDVMATLSLEEQAEFRMRFEGSAGLLSGRLEAMNGTEQEFRALRPLLDEYRQQTRALPGGDNFSATTYADLNQKALDRIAAAIGPDRALDYLWSGPGLFPELLRFAHERGLPSTTAARVMQLAAETGVRASAIHHDAAIPAEKKSAALQELQASVGTEFERLVPAPLQSQLPPQALEWFTMLGEGRYMGWMASLSGTGFGTIAPVSVSTRSTGRAWPIPLRPRT